MRCICKLPESYGPDNAEASVQTAIRVNGKYQYHFETELFVG